MAPEGVEKQTCSHWDRRKRSKDDEGATTVKPEPALISSTEHEQKVRHLSGLDAHSRYATRICGGATN